MSKKKTTKPEAENPEVENPQVEQPEVEKPEVEQTEQANTQPDYVKELLEKGVTVLQGRSRGELDGKLAAIPSNINYYTGAVGTYLDTGIVRIQVNLRED